MDGIIRHKHPDFLRTELGTRTDGKVLSDTVMGLSPPDGPRPRTVGGVLSTVTATCFAGTRAAPDGRSSGTSPDVLEPITSNWWLEYDDVTQVRLHI